ncbi:predicted protein [Naegleria gruberi]|uniref:Predicted protein n=1 Tax=Naegleria gruberi TaxID=5762 RepID=D2VKQ6_NAEGR|nr:uncharacterized protein NAEGRDRAFT_69478 [Naegleria gruberi]EFC42734.1 predicted protein [Naegleria gruberi]|eukprot:XP_002675478.1 predicted protein [Naegleria gruberi strain NEG-M]
MVKIYGLFILKQQHSSKPLVLSSNVDSGWYSFFYTDQITEITVFLAKLLAEKTQPGLRQQVEKDDLVGYVQKTKEGMSCVLVTDKDYPLRVAFDLVRYTLRAFSDWLMKSSFTTFTKDNECSQFNAQLKELMTKYQDPTKGDTMYKLKQDIEDTKEVLHQTLDKLLERGTHIDKLIEQTNELSDGAKDFYRKTRKSTCCTIL